MDADGMLHEEEKQGTEPTKLSPRRILTGAALAGSRRKRAKLMSKQSKRKMRSKKKDVQIFKDGLQGTEEGQGGAAAFLLSLL